MSFDMNKKLNKQMKSNFALLPELEPIQGRINSVKVQPKLFKGQQAYVQDQEGNFILDIVGAKIPKYEFLITIDLLKFSTPDGSPRKQWLRVGTSVHAKSNLTKLLSQLKLDLPDPTGIAIVNALTGKDIKFQLINKDNPQDPEKPWQNIVLESVRSVDSKPISPMELTAEPIEWDDLNEKT